MNKYIQVVTIIWLSMIITAGSLLLLNLIKYLLDNDFREWHIMILWALIIPTSTMIVLLAKYNKKVS